VELFVRLSMRWGQSDRQRLAFHRFASANHRSFRALSFRAILEMASSRKSERRYCNTSEAYATDLGPRARSKPARVENVLSSVRKTWWFLLSGRSGPRRASSIRLT
jgi:hypothetical protein